MKSTAWIVAGIMGATCFTGGALAADDTMKGEKASQASQRYEQGHAREKLGKVTPADQITGMVVKTSTGEELGKVQQLLVASDQGRVAYVILAAGGILGVGETQYIIPFSALRQDASGKNFTLNMDTQKLKGGPKYVERNLDDPKFGQEVHSYYGVTPYWTEQGTQQWQGKERRDGEGMPRDNMRMRDDGQGMNQGTQENKK